MTRVWHIISGEYPPQPGGVSDYSQAVAEALAAAGDEVHVWAPPATNSVVAGAGSPVLVHRLPDAFGDAALDALTRGLNQGRLPRTVLVQYVPHAFGARGMNLRFCRWVQHRARTAGEDVRVMFHEPYFPFVAWPLHHNALAFANRVMAVLLLSDIRVAYVSTRAWRRRLAHYAPRALRFEWLPIPASVPAADDQAAVTDWRTRLANRPGDRVVGHFGTFGELVSRVLAPAVEVLLARRPDVRLCLIGTGSEGFAARMAGARPQWRDRIAATGTLAATGVSACIRACDVMLQPYADGASGRRTTLMAALVNGVAVITTDGPATEPEWSAERAVALVRRQPAALAEAVARLLDDDAERQRMGQAGHALYERRFALRHTIEQLRAEPAGKGQ